MSVHEKLHTYLFRYGCKADDEITDVRFAPVPEEPLRLRDRLFPVGQILEEDEAEAVYVLQAGGGFLRMNPAVLAMCLRDGALYVSGYAREGIIGQHTCARVLAQLEAILNEAFPDQRRDENSEVHQEMDEGMDPGPDHPGGSLGAGPGPADPEGDKGL